MNIRVQGPDGVIIEFPQGTDNAVIMGVMQKRYGGPQQQAPAQAQAMPETGVAGSMDGMLPPDTQGAAPAPQGVGIGNELRRIGRGMDDAARIGANALTFGLADRFAGAMPGGQGTDAERKQTAQSRERLGPVASTAIDIGSGAATGKGLMDAGLTAARLAPNAGIIVRALLGGVDGAALGAANAAGYGEDVKKGAWDGFLGGGAGSLFGEALAGTIRGVGRGLQALRSTPEDRASKLLYKAAKQDNITPQILGQRLDDLGPEAVLADVMGERGIALARGANTASPEARAAFSYLTERQQGQNARVVDALERATGFGGKTPDAIKEADALARAPAINAAYNASRASGADLPSEAMQLLRQSPAFNEAYEAAGKSVANRSAAEAILKGGQPAAASANSEFARLNAVKIHFDSVGKAARRAGNDGAANEAEFMAKAVRKVIDDMLPEASAARGLAREGFRFEEAVDLGASLAKGRITADDIASAAKAAPEVQPGLAQGYAAQLAQNLSNARRTPGALNALDTEFSSQAAKAALRDNADELLKQVAREREFNRTASILGNSKTADKMMDMKMIAQEGSILGGLVGADYMYGTGTGAGGVAAALARRGGKALSQSMSDRRLQELAPLVAQALMARQLPKQAAFGTPNMLERIGADNREAIVRALMASGAIAVPSAITNP